MKFKLFGQEIENYKQMVKETPKKKKYKGTITISYSNFTTDGEGFVKGQQFISVQFDGHNEGSGSPCLNEEEANKHIEYLKNLHSEFYDIEVIDKR